MRIRVNDTVEVITGDEAAGKTRAKVLKVDHEAGKVLVENVNRVYKHVRRSQRNPKGGRLSKEMPVSISNVKLVCEKCGAAARMGARFLDDGSKERYCKKCGAGTGQLSPAKAHRAKK
jgi:large subunit ribosomal protein L24